jgi:cell division protein FtsL
MTSRPSVYRIFRHDGGAAASVRLVVIALVVIAAMLTALGVQRVASQHEVLRLGYELSRRAEEVRHLREVRRQLELELATLSSPDRIRRLATQLGMTQIAPDRIRVVRGHKVATR